MATLSLRYNWTDLTGAATPVQILTYLSGYIGRRLIVKSIRLCGLGGCERKHYARGWCKNHYRRWMDNGDPGSVYILDRSKIRVCSIDGCSKIHRQYGYCAMHFERWRKHGDPHYVAGVFGQSGDQHYKWLGDEATYIAVHHRIRKELGSARVYLCAKLCSRQARHWAYNHQDFSERVDETTGMLFTVNLDNYQPLCASCHKLLDLSRARGGT